jgi:hypothetical protein
MMEHRDLLVFPQVFDVVDIEHPERLDWRRCTLSVRAEIRTNTYKIWFCAKVLDKSSGRGAHDLFEGSFVAAIETLARALLSVVPGLAEPTMLSTGFLIRGGSRAYARDDGAALLSYELPDHIGDHLLRLQGHTTLQVIDHARQVADHQACVRAAAPG